MKKLTEYKELDAATFDNSRLPLRCRFIGNRCNSTEEDIGNLHGFGFELNEDYETFNYDKGLCFRDHEGDLWYKAYEIIERYPRDVPRWVSELPEDKPFLAYLGKYITEQIKPFPKGTIYIHTVTVNPEEWEMLQELKNVRN